MPPSPEATKAILARVWEKNLPLLRERLDHLQAAADALHHGPLTADAEAEAAGIAHKLAGSLGMFGYLRGTDAARKLELSFESGTPEAEAVQMLLHELRTDLNFD